VPVVGLELTRQALIAHGGGDLVILILNLIHELLRRGADYARSVACQTAQRPGHRLWGCARRNYGSEGCAAGMSSGMAPGVWPGRRVRSVL
jgi:hypothetical protein